MLTELCAEIRNYFLGADPMRNIHHGTYTISGGKLAPLDFLKEGQYFRIVGSTLNDGVYQYPETGMIDESFSGAVWAMAVPPDVIALADDIRIYEDRKNTLSEQCSCYSSESFGGYSYSIDESWKLPWQISFAPRLKKYRRYSVL